MPDLADSRVRLARRVDLDRIVGIYNATSLLREVTADLEPVTVKSHVPWFEAHQPECHPLWVAELDGVCRSLIIVGKALDGTEYENRK